MKNDNANNVHSTVLDTRQYTRALTTLSGFFDVATKGREGRCASITGPSGSGKSTLISAFLRLHPPRSEDGKTIRPVVYAKVPPKPSIRTFYEALLEVLGAPCLSRESNGDRRNRVLRFLKDGGTKCLIVDEFQQLASAVGTDQAGVCDTIKSLMNDGRIGIAMVGVPEAEGVIAQDEQVLRRRIATIRLRAFCDTQNPAFRGPEGAAAMTAEFLEFKGVLQEFSAGFGCPDARYICDDAVAHHLLVYTRGLFGRIVNFVEAAARDARRRDRSDIDAAAIQEALQIMLPDQDAWSEVDASTKVKSRSPGKMSKRERDIRAATGEFTTRNGGSGDRAASENEDPSGEEK